jgi:hypothetical protein
MAASTPTMTIADNSSISANPSFEDFCTKPSSFIDKGKGRWEWCIGVRVINIELPIHQGQPNLAEQFSKEFVRIGMVSYED